MYWLVYTLLTVIAIYLLLSFIVYRNAKLISGFPFQSCTEADFFAKQTPRYLAYHQDMLENGFQLDSLLYAEQNNIDHYLAAYSHPDEPSLFGGVYSLDNQLSKLRFDYIELNQTYADGTSLCIANANQAPGYPQVDPNRLLLLYPKQQRAAELLKTLHTLHWGLKNNVAATNDLWQKPVPDTINKYAREENQHIIDRGWCKAEHHDHLHPLTYRGALSLTWRHLPILINFVFWQRCYQSQRLLDQATKASS